MGRLTLSPYVSVSLAYDSNVRPLEQDFTLQGEPSLRKVSDTLHEVQVGTFAVWLDDDWQINGSAWGFWRRYHDLDVEDEEGFGARFALARGDRDRLALSAFQLFERRFDFALEAAPASPPPSPVPGGEIVLADEFTRNQFERDLLLFGINAGRDLGDRIELDGGVSYRKTDYKDGRFFDESGHAISFSAGRRLRAETTAFLHGGYGEEDNENYVKAVPYYRVLAGLRATPTEKTSYNVGVGYQRYDRAEQRPRVLDDGSTVFSDGTMLLEDGTQLPPQPLRNPVTGEEVDGSPAQQNDSQDGLAYNAEITWRPTTKLFFGLSTRNEFRSSFTGDQREVQMAQLSAGYSPLESFQISLRIGYWMEEAVDKILLFDDEGNERRITDRRETLTAAGRIGFRPPQRGYELYAGVSYEEVQSSIELQSYNRTRFAAGLRVTY